MIFLYLGSIIGRVKEVFTGSGNAFYIALITVLFSCSVSRAQTDSTLHRQVWNFHYQSTVITQQHPAFSAKYSGVNSLDHTSEFHSSISSTLYFGARLWKGASAYFNPELSGGEGFSRTTGIAGFPNGEVYRVSDPKPHIYIARIYFTQVIALGNTYSAAEDELNQLASVVPDTYFSITAGKFSLMDFFDDNAFSHDPRTQFYNWALMGNGAWDYAANTRGYTNGVIFTYHRPGWDVRTAWVMVSIVANGQVMEQNMLRAGAWSIEYEKHYFFGGKAGTLRLISFLNRANMGSYKQAIQWGMDNAVTPSVDSVADGIKSKYGFGVNLEQQLGRSAGLFLRASWNDGLNETWEFTEIDRAFSLGIVWNGAPWHRSHDNLGMAQIINGLSPDHRDYLKAGGSGFIIGDGTLSYQPEMITEVYYSFMLGNTHMTLSPDYQLIIHPAYNTDRGPVQAFGMRMHVEY